MTPGRIHDPEGAKTIVVSFKTTTGAILAVQRQTYKIVCFRDIDNIRLRVDTTTRVRRKHDMHKQHRRVIRIYKAHMYTEASLDPERCTHTSDEKAMRIRLVSHLRQINQYEDINNPYIYWQEVDTMEEAEGGTEQPIQTKNPPPPNTSVQQPLAGAQAHDPTADIGVVAWTWVPPVTGLRFGKPDPPRPCLARNGPATINSAKLDQIRFAPLVEQVSTLGGGHNEALSSSILSEGAASVASSSTVSKGRDPTPLTPETLHLLDRLELDKGKQTRLLTEHLTWQSILPATEEELQQHMERKVAREIKRQHAAAEAAANKAIE